MAPNLVHRKATRTPQEGKAAHRHIRLIPPVLTRKDELSVSEIPMADPTPLHWSRPTSRNPISGGSWVGRASRHRREQVRARGPEAVREGPTGPVESSRTTAAPDAARVQELCAPVVQMLMRELDGLSSVLVCTAGGTPLAAFGIAEADASAAARGARSMFTAGGGRPAARPGESGVTTVKLTSGPSHTVITLVDTPEHGDHLLSVACDGTSLAVVLLRTRQAADDLRPILSAAAVE